MAVIYELINRINGKRYIGKTTNVRKRLSQHKHRAKENRRHPLYDAIRHYGFENFEMRVLFEADEASINELERQTIAEMNPEYNVSRGGDGGDTFSGRSKASQTKTRQKLSKIMKDRWADSEYREAQSQQMKDRWAEPEYREQLQHSLGKTHTHPNYREKMVAIARNRAKDPEYRKRLSRGVKRAIKQKRNVWSECKRGSQNGRWLGKLQMTFVDGTVIVFESAVECSEKTGLVAHYIRRKADSGEAMQRGKYRGATFCWVRQ